MYKSHKHAGCERGFTQLSAAYYGPALLADGKLIDEVMLGFYHPDGGTTGEFAIRWTRLAGKITPRLEAFDDSWNALWGFRDVMARFADVDGEDISPSELCALLIECGVKNRTETSRDSGAVGNDTPLTVLEDLLAQIESVDGTSQLDTDRARAVLSNHKEI